MASIPSAKPKHTKANVWKRAISPKNHMTPRITAQTTATPITYTMSGKRLIPQRRHKAKAASARTMASYNEIYCVCIHDFLLLLFYCEIYNATTDAIIHASSVCMTRNVMHSQKALSRFCFNRNAPWQPVHRPSTPGDCNADAVWSHNPELGVETPLGIPVTA